VARRRAQPQPKREVEFNFFSFPALAAFVFGVFLASLAIAFDIGGFVGSAHPILWYASLFGMAFVLAHLFTHQFARFRRERRRQQEEEEERERRALAARARSAAAERQEEAPRRRRRRRRA
jgi:membrane protein implicated in regulation of membrane protease activity